METFPFIQENISKSSRHCLCFTQPGLAGYMPRAAALPHTCHSSTVPGSVANTRCHLRDAINIASSITSDRPGRWCPLFILFQLPKQLAVKEIPRWSGKPQKQRQHTLAVSSLPCSATQSRGTQAERAEAVWLLELGDAGRFSLARRLSGFQDSKLFVQIKLWMGEKNHPSLR